MNDAFMAQIVNQSVTGNVWTADAAHSLQQLA